MHKDSELFIVNTIRLSSRKKSLINSSGEININDGAYLGSNVTVLESVVIGSNAGDALTDADYNTAVGMNALSADTKGSNSTAIGNFIYAIDGGQNNATDIQNSIFKHNKLFNLN